jgi:hypothetical protein
MMQALRIAYLGLYSPIYGCAVLHNLNTLSQYMTLVFMGLKRLLLDVTTQSAQENVSI